ncbi:hypothetical protein GE09DRAFT_1230792 [Coniochaeta sp. 2T2.1]|nr:hypothetical protein GE09DRAFT_1230792 [Coniochaeta sp. 2T2.1]
MPWQHTAGQRLSIVGSPSCIVIFVYSLLGDALGSHDDGRGNYSRRGSFTDTEELVERWWRQCRKERLAVHEQGLLIAVAEVCLPPRVVLPGSVDRR